MRLLKKRSGQSKGCGFLEFKSGDGLKVSQCSVYMHTTCSIYIPNHVTSTSICNVSSKRSDTAGHVDVGLKLDIARYHMIKLQINLVSFSAATIFLARVVHVHVV